MPKLKIAIVDDSKAEVNKLEEVLGKEDDIQLVGCAANGEDALTMIKTIKPDLVLMDIIMPKKDGLEVMELVKDELSSKDVPEYIVLQKAGEEMITKDAFRLGAAYFLTKPVNIQFMLDRIRYFGQLKQKRSHMNITIKNEKLCCFNNLIINEKWELPASRLLMESGMAASKKGFPLLKDSVIGTIYKPELIQSVTKVLYPMIAKLYGITPCNVEKNMRTAIDIAWEKGNPEFFSKVFHFNKFNPKSQRPTVSAFIAGVADYLRLEENENNYVK